MRAIPERTDARFLLVRTSALGDIVHGLPVLVALRRLQPESRIAWVVEEAFAPLLGDHPDLDEVIPVQMRAWRNRPWTRRTRREIVAARRRLRHFGPDVACDLMSNHKAGALAWLSGAPLRVGLDRAHRREPSSVLWINQPVPPRGPHAVERAMSVLAPLGGAEIEIDFAGDRLCPEALDPHPSTARRRIVLLPGAGWPNKRYPEVALGRSGRLLAEKTGAPLLAVTGPGEEGLGEAVERASDGAVRHLPVPDLRALVGLLRSSRLVVGGDTGPLHLAHALGTPVLSLHGPTDPLRHGPWGRPEATLVHRLPCSFCYKRFDAPRPCLQNLSPLLIAETAAAAWRAASGLAGDGASEPTP